MICNIPVSNAGMVKAFTGKREMPYIQYSNITYMIYNIYVHCSLTLHEITFFQNQYAYPRFYLKIAVICFP